MATDTMPANPAAAPLIEGQRETHRLLIDIRDALERREEPAPGLFRIYPSALSMHVRVRATTVVITSSAAALRTVAVRSGANNLVLVRIGDATISLDLPVTLDRGVTVSLVDPATGATPADILDAFIIGYPDHGESDSRSRNAMHERLG